MEKQKTREQFYYERGLEIVQNYAKKIGVKCSGVTRRRKKLMQFELQLDGYESRWISVPETKYRKNPFSQLTLNEKKQRVERYANRWGATLGRVKTNARKDGWGVVFEICKPGYDSRWIALSRLNKANDPFARATFNEQKRDVQNLAKKFGARLTGKTRNKTHLQFELSKNGYANRWITVGHARQGENPFSRRILEDLESVVIKKAKRLHAQYRKGDCRKQGKNWYFCLRKKGYEPRWCAITVLEENCNPFRKPTPGEQLLKVKSLVRKLRMGAKFSGRTRKVHQYQTQYEIIAKGRDPRWVSLHQLQRSNPFLKPTQGEQEREVLRHVKRLGAIYKGEFRGNLTNRKYCLYKKGLDPRWVNLASLREKNNPWFYKTINELISLVNQQMKRYRSFCTGRTRRHVPWFGRTVNPDTNKKVNNYLEFEIGRIGTSDKVWTTLAHAKHHNPWRSGGYDAKLPGYFYFGLLNAKLRVGGGEYVGYGVTNDLKARTNGHTNRLFRRHIVCDGWVHKRWRNGNKPLEVEGEILHWMEKHGYNVDLKVHGFRREAFIRTPASMRALYRILRKYKVPLERA